MNVISWENGDSTITDLPACSDQMLARIVQNVNDSICTHRDGDLLCPSCSLAVLELGHRTVGTGSLPLTDLERRQVWVRVAADQARQVLHLVRAADRPVALAAIVAAEGWAADPCERTRAAAFDAAVAAVAAAADAAAAASSDAAYAAASSAAASAAAYAADAADAAYDAAAAYAAAARLRLAHRAIDLFEHLTGHKPTPTDPAVTAAAVERMKETVSAH